MLSTTIFGQQVCVPLLQFLFGTCGDAGSLLKNREEFGDLKCPPTPTSNKLMTEHVMKTPTSSVRRSLRDVGTPKTPSVINATFAQSAKKKLLFQGCKILYQLLKNGDTSSSDHCTALPGKLRNIWLRLRDSISFLQYSVSWLLILAITKHRNLSLGSSHCSYTLLYVHIFDTYSVNEHFCTHFKIQHNFT